jgi:steroid delta-isomerase-like uncharacterized protein
MSQILSTESCYFDPYQVLLQKHVEAENAHSLEDTLATLTHNCVFEDKALDRVFRGQTEVGTYYQLWWNAFNVTVCSKQRHWVPAGPLIAETRFQGIHYGSFLGIPPTGRRMDLPVIIVATFQNGLIAGERFYYNLTTLLYQLNITEIPANLP